MLHLAQKAGEAPVALQFARDVLARVLGRLAELLGRRKGRFLLLLRRADELHLVERLLRRAKTRFVPLELARELAGVRRAARMQDGEVQQRRVAAATRDQSLDRRR